MCSNAPVSKGEFATCWAALSPGKRVALAVSGGRDSMALARLAAAHGARIGANVIAFTVDHGLREASAAEAAQTAAWCDAIGLSCDVLTWRGEKPETGVQAAARAARYRLLAAATENAAASALITAHSADDQAETVFMRLARGAGVSGLAGMDDDISIAAGAGAPVRLLRPLLSFSRARLTATVNTYGQPFIDDQSNDDPKFERVRVRALLGALEENDLLTRDALFNTAARMRKTARRLRAAEDAAFRKANGCFYRWGGAALDARFLKAERDGSTAGLARRLIRAVSGAEHAPHERDTEVAFEAALETGGASLGGALIRLWRDRLWFLREPAAVCGRRGEAALAPLDIPPGARALWDGRFVIENAQGAEPVTVVPSQQLG